MVTRNTKLYKTSFNKGSEKVNIYYRDLTVLEISFLNNIKNQFVKHETAGEIAIYNSSTNEIPIGVKARIGEEILIKSSELANDVQLLEINVSEFRESLKQDDTMMAIKNILRVLPGQSITELLKLTHKDLIEIICLCEELTGKQIFNFGQKRGTTLVNPKELPDDGASLQEKMKALNSHLGI